MMDESRDNNEMEENFNKKGKLNFKDVFNIVFFYTYKHDKLSQVLLTAK